ncbi:hypothetical protein ACP4OV_016108 [Aristida adscensionis]
MAEFAGYLVPHGKAHPTLAAFVQGEGGVSSGGASVVTGTTGWSSFGTDGIADLIDRLTAGMKDAMLYPNPQ